MSASQAQTPSLTDSTFDFDTGLSPVEVILPILQPIMLEHVSATGGDATLILRIATVTNNAWFDATAPYHPTAVGVYSHLGRRPQDEATNSNINTAIMYSTLRILNNLLPTYEQSWRDMMTNIGLDPDDQSTDITTPTGLGNVAGYAVSPKRWYESIRE